MASAFLVFKGWVGSWCEVCFKEEIPSEWEIIQDNLSENVAHFETLFTLSNGHFGTRGTLEEGTLNKKEGSYINGFYETNPIIYGETAFGYAKNSQTICQVPDGKGISFAINGH